jgi:uncharacterized protein (DUF486 family)
MSSSGFWTRQKSAFPSADWSSGFASPQPILSVWRSYLLAYARVTIASMRTIVVTVCLLIASNVFMTFAWYAHLRNLSSRPWYVAAFASWGIALFEYLLQVPANRIGYHQLSLAQLKIVQEVVTLSVFVPFAVFYMRQPINLNFLWAGLCLLGAVFFIFR